MGINNSAICTNNLSKHYGKINAVKNLNIEIKRVRSFLYLVQMVQGKQQR